MGPMLTQVPPNIGSHRTGDLLDLAKLAWSKRGITVRTTADATRLLTMSIADLLDDWFESPQIKGALAVNGVIGTWAGPYEPGTAYVMAHHSIGDVGDGQLGSWGFPEGGMGGVSAAIAESARSFGAEIRTNARVTRMLVRNGRVHGAVLENGDELHAPLVVTTLHPKTALHRDIVGPHEMQEEYGLIGGNIFHGELSLEQLFYMRPPPGYADYRTPIAGLYSGSSGTHAGGGVCEIPGWQAARAALAGKKRGLKRFRHA